MHCVAVSSTVAFGLTLAITIGHCAESGVERPNVVLVVTDDQGYGDLSCHGNPILNTPNLDQLHAESVRFTDFHVDPTCSPTRGALMSGKYSHRAKVWHTIAGGNHLRASEVTMADVFRASGYCTGIFGKWHLGSNHPYRPIDRGFDQWLGHGDGGTGTTDDYFDNDRVNDTYWKNGQREQIDGFATDVFFDAAIDFIKDNRQRPFFVYLATYTPHSPHTVPDPAWTKPYVGQVRPGEAFFFSTIDRVDKNIGRIRRTLVEQGLSENTVFIFLTDNGGTGGVSVFNAGMRGKKGQVYDGGHRVPLLIHWPAGKLRHGQDVSELTAHIDVLPTLIDLCGLKPPERPDFDGRSFRTQLIESGAKPSERTVVVERQRTFEPEKWSGAVAMNGNWRLVNDAELYDIAADPGQTHNVIDQNPAIVSMLREEFELYWQHVTPGDRDRVIFTVGHPADPEVLLQSMDWYLPSVPWNHQHVAQGPTSQGSWWVSVAKSGAYRFELRRWPREADGPIAGVPPAERFPKQPDAWDSRGGKPYIIYAGEASPFQSLPVEWVRLRVGDYEEIKPVRREDKSIAFDLNLEVTKYEVSAELLDERKESLGGVCYVYCRPAGQQADATLRVP